MPSSPTNSFPNQHRWTFRCTPAGYFCLVSLAISTARLTRSGQRFAPAHFVDPFFHVFRAALFEVLAEVKFPQRLAPPCDESQARIRDQNPNGMFIAGNSSPNLSCHGESLPSKLGACVDCGCMMLHCKWPHLQRKTWLKQVAAGTFEHLPHFAFNERLWKKFSLEWGVQIEWGVQNAVWSKWWSCSHAEGMLFVTKTREHSLSCSVWGHGMLFVLTREPSFWHVCHHGSRWLKTHSVPPSKILFVFSSKNDGGCAIWWSLFRGPHVSMCFCIRVVCVCVWLWPWWFFWCLQTAKLWTCFLHFSVWVRICCGYFWYRVRSGLWWEVGQLTQPNQ